MYQIIVESESSLNVASDTWGQNLHKLFLSIDSSTAEQNRTAVGGRKGNDGRGTLIIVLMEGGVVLF